MMTFDDTIKLYAARQMTITTTAMKLKTTTMICAVASEMMTKKKK